LPERSASDDGEASGEEALAERPGVSAVVRVEVAAAQDDRFEPRFVRRLADDPFGVERGLGGPVRVRGRVLVERAPVGLTRHPDDALEDDTVGVDGVRGRDDVLRAGASNAVVRRPVGLLGIRVGRYLGRGVHEHVAVGRGVDDRVAVEDVAARRLAAAFSDGLVPLVVSRQSHDVVSATGARGDESTTEHARRASDEHSHTCGFATNCQRVTADARRVFQVQSGRVVG
jgi:hypothetical protein